MFFLYILFPCCCESDCIVEQPVKYGQSYYIHLNHVDRPITLQFRCSRTAIRKKEASKKQGSSVLTVIALPQAARH